MSKQSWLEALDRIRSRTHRADEFLSKGGMTWVRDGFAGHPRSPSLDAGQSTAPAPPDDNPKKPKEYLPPELRGRESRSDPTASAAVQALNYGDQAHQDAKRVGKILDQMDKLSDELDGIVTRYTPRSASLFDQQEASDPEPGCVSCARVDSPGTVGKDKRNRTPWWNAVAREVALADGSTAALCEWCRTHARATGELPDKADVEAYRDGRRVQRRSA